MKAPRTGQDELVRILRGQEALVQEVYSILEEEEKKDDVLRAVVLSSLKPCTNRIAGLDALRIFTLDDIRRTCIRYRLRFLPAGRFKGDVPTEALHTIRRLEARSDGPLGGFMILAPAKRFRLCDCDADPLLFVPLRSGNYYLVHRWGNDLRPARAIFGWPVRSPMHLAITVLAATLLLSLALPTAWLTEGSAPWWNLQRFGVFLCTTLVAGAATSFGWFAFFGQFSNEAWDSKTFN